VRWCFGEDMVLAKDNIIVLVLEDFGDVCGWVFVTLFEYELRLICSFGVGFMDNEFDD
jgi:hypothetical protein